MLNEKTREELEQLSLVPFARNVSGKIGKIGHVYADPFHTTWQGDAFATIQYLAELVHRGVDISDVPFYQRVQDVDGMHKEYAHISHFKHRAEEKYAHSRGGKYWYFSFDNLLSQQKNRRKCTKERETRQANEHIRVMYMTGNPEGEMRCPLRPEIPIGVHNRRGKTIYGLADAHHIVCHKGESLQKDNTDPGKLNIKCNWLDAQNGWARIALDDLLRTVLVSKHSHAEIHVWRQSDVESYDTYELPWGLQCEENYNVFTGYLERAGHTPFISYADHMETLTLQFHGITPNPKEYMRPNSTFER